MDTAEGQGPSTSPADTSQTELPLGQSAALEDSGISDVSIAHRIPKDICSDRCQATTVTFEDDNNPTREWVTCELSLALAQANMPEILTIIKKIRAAQNGTDEKNSPKCPVQIYAESLITFISAKIAQALSSRQVQEEFRTPVSSPRSKDMIGED